MRTPALQYMVIEGPIGVGKTALAKRLAETFAAEPLLERAHENPFLPRFYRDRQGAALPTQLHFLFRRTRLIDAIRQADMFKPGFVCDFLLQKDRLFARVTLDDAEYELYEQVYGYLSVETPLPNLVVYMQAPVYELMRRIRERGVGFEQAISEDYLQRICDAYVEFFYHYNASPLLIINTEEFDVAGSDADYELLLDHIRRLSPGRHYLNPQQL